MSRRLGGLGTTARRPVRGTSGLDYFCRIKDWRRIATRYDKLARNFLAATALVGALYWIKL
jgi:transposase